jgi:hypothetical protein
MLAQLVNSTLRLIGLKVVRLSSLRQLQSRTATSNTNDIRSDTAFMDLFMKVHDKTMVGLERSYALYKALNAILDQNIPGALVECGVWKGGSCMLMANILLNKGKTDRHIYLYDTYEGMTQPGKADGDRANSEWSRLKREGEQSDWCRSTLEEVTANMQSTGYPAEKIFYVKGKVENTIPGTIPAQVALLRLDTDWYESTRHELQHLFPKLVPRGVLLIDDYGAWQGARKATDEFFKDLPYYHLRIDHSGLLVVKA